MNREYNTGEIPRYRKKSKKRPPKKADHKHIFEPCVFEYRGRVLDEMHGFIDGPVESRIGSYCPVCGRVGPAGSGWYRREPDIFHSFGRSILTEEAQIQIDPETRTLPTFRLEDDLFQKKISLETGAKIDG